MERPMMQIPVSEEFQSEYFKLFLEIANAAYEQAQKDVGMNKRYLNKNEAAEYLNMSWTFFNNNVSPQVQKVQVGSKTLYDKTDIISYMESQKIK